MAAHRNATRNVTLTRRPRRPIARPLIYARDILTAGWLALVLAIVTTMPVVWQWKLCRSLAFFALMQRRARRARTVVTEMCWFDRGKASDTIRRLYAGRLFQNCNLVSGILWGPRQRITFVGLEHLLRALELKHGVVLWMSDFVEAGDAVKIGLHSRGLPISHLSRPEHGFSGSQLGIAWLNPVRTRYEDRFLAERIIFDREHPQLAHKRLAAVLQQNGIACITASHHEGVSLAEADFLKGRIRLATGAPRTAYRTECPILPVFVLRDHNEPLAYSLVIEHPLDLPNTTEYDEALRRAVADYVGRLERYVSAYPDLWVGWRRLDMLAN